MGTVYLAEHPRLHRPVALKVLHDSLAGDTATRAAFDREAELASRLDHPNIVPVYDRNAPGERQLWLSMRYLAGGDVKTLLDSVPDGLPVEQVVRLITDAGHALDHAHAQGVLHRDVKPENLLLDRDPRHGETAVLTDFGIARARDATVTSMGWTLAYVAPERFGNTLSDHRADIYSLGCTLVHLLTGQPPFPRGSSEAVMAAHLYEPPPALTMLRPGLPRYLDAVITTVLAKDPGDRYPSCAALVADLARATTATVFNPASAPATGQHPNPPHPPDANRPAPGEERGGSFHPGFRPYQGPPAARVDEPATADQLVGAGYELERQGDLAGAEQKCRQAAQAGNADAMLMLAFLLEQREDHTEAEQWWRKAAAAGDERAMLHAGEYCEKRGEDVEAEQWYLQAERTRPGFADLELGRLYEKRGDYESAERRFHALAEQDDPLAGSWHLGGLYEKQDDHAAAKKWYLKAAAAAAADPELSSLRKIAEGKARGCEERAQEARRGSKER
jgi:Tfp pilus assembly protein PilF